MQELSQATKKLISQYKLALQQSQPQQGVATIHVDEVAKKVAAFYERIRTIVDWKEEHLMRRAAIIRKLKRKFFDLELSNFSDTASASESLVLELIRGGHFPNDKIAESKIVDVQNVIDKYVFILKNNPENRQGKAGIQFYNWLVEVAACEIEETLHPSIKELALIDFMFSEMKKKIKVSDKIYEAGLLNPEFTYVQIYIAVCQSLFKLDKPMISYNLIRYRYPNWDKADSQLISDISQKMFKIWQKTEQDMENPVANKFYYICEKYDTPYLLIGDIFSSAEGVEAITNIEKQIQEPPALESKLKDAYSKRLSTLKSRINRAAIYSTISIFVTKVLTLLLLEVIVLKATHAEVNPVLLSADVLIPTILMLWMVMSVKRPSKKNLSIVTMETIKVAYKNENHDVYDIKPSRKKTTAMKFVLSLIYVLCTFVVFFALIYVLNYFGFSALSIVTDIIFISLILFAGTAVQKIAQELTMEPENENFLTFLADIFFLPMQGLGRWLSTKWKKYNAIAALFNALIDMPFSAFVNFLEKWRYFIKERKEEIR